MSTITIRRDPIGRFSAKSILKQFATWLTLLPFRILGAFIRALYWILSKVLPSRRAAWKILFVEFAITGWLVAAFVGSLHFNVRCAEGGGWFTTKQECGEMSVARFEAMEAARMASLADTSPAESPNCIGNEDICN